MNLEIKKVEVAQIDPTKAYMVSVEVGDMPKENVTEFCNNIKKKLEEMGFNDFVIMPCKDGVPSVKFTEVKDSTDLGTLSKGVKEEK